MTHNDTHNSSMNLFLASKYADTYIGDNEANCVFNIREGIVPEPDTRILCAVSDLEIPYSFYIFRTTNNELKIQITAGALVSYTLAVGNYNINQLVEAFNTTGSTLQVNNITASYDANTNKLSFVHASTTIALVPSTTTMLKEIGFKKGQTGAASTITGENMVDLSGLANIFLRSNLGTENYDSNNAVSGTLCKIPVNVLPLEYIFYRPIEVLYVRLSDRQITTINVSIQDEEGNILNLNGGRFSFTLSIHFQYERMPKFKEEEVPFVNPQHSNLSYLRKDDEEKNNIPIL